MYITYSENSVIRPPVICPLYMKSSLWDQLMMSTLRRCSGKIGGGSGKRG